MSLLQAGVDTSVIALWLGHASPRSTTVYIRADITIKEKALAHTVEGEELLAFLSRHLHL